MTQPDPYEIDRLRREKRAAREARRRREQWLIWLYGVGLVGLAIGVVGFIDRERSRVKAGWARTTPDGPIAIEVDSYMASRGRRRVQRLERVYRVFAKYSFEVDGRTYKGERKYPQTPLAETLLTENEVYDSEAEARRATARLADSPDLATVRYNPADPSQSTMRCYLDNWLRTITMVEIAAGLALAVAGFGGNWLFKRLGWAAGTSLE